MRAGPIVAAAAIVAYLGFEMHAVGRNSYRTERDFVFQQFVGAAKAITVCGGGDENQHDRFQANSISVRRRALEHIQANNPSLDQQAQLAALAELEFSAASETQELIDRKGCDDIEVWKLQKRYQNLSRLNLR